MDKLHV